MSKKLYTKQEINEKLDYLQGAILDAYIDVMDSKRYEELTALASLSNHLAKNSKVAEKEKSTINDEIKERVEAAKARRKN
jgi:uncharacterized protein YfkK (UPF0435 family)